MNTIKISYVLEFLMVKAYIRTYCCLKSSQLMSIQLLTVKLSCCQSWVMTLCC